MVGVRVRAGAGACAACHMAAHTQQSAAASGAAARPVPPSPAQGRRPLDLLAIPTPAQQGARATAVLAWGGGENWALGTGGRLRGPQQSAAVLFAVPCAWLCAPCPPPASGRAVRQPPNTSARCPLRLAGSTELTLTPTRVELPAEVDGVCALAASKFHSAAVTCSGHLYTWGWGRGGRLGECWRGLVSSKAPGGAKHASGLLHMRAVGHASQRCVGSTTPARPALSGNPVPNSCP